MTARSPVTNRFRIAPLLSAAAIAYLLAQSGCARVKPTPEFALKPPAMMKNGVVLDVMFISFPLGEEAMNDVLWREIDELHFPADARRRFAANGLRAGIIGGPLPLELESRLELQEKPKEQDDLSAKFDLTADRGPARRELRILAGRRANIITLGEKERVPEVSLLLCDRENQVKGRTYRDVMGLFAAKAFPQGDGGIKLELTPEIEHGAPQKRFVPGDGMFRVEFGPPHEVLDEYKLTAQLGPGQFLALTADPAKPGSLGYRYFTDSQGDAIIQKLLLIRFAHCDHDDRFTEGKSPAFDRAMP